METEETELHSFPYDANIGGIEHHYRITQNDEKYGIEQDGVVIAAVQNKNGYWTQISGSKLSKELLDSICDHIESYYA